MQKPNILLFVADQMRADTLHHLGNEASCTPNLDSIISEQQGVSFNNAYAQNPVCVPSRISFLTGLYPHTTGHRTMHYLQNEFEPNILKEMKANGYEVIWIGRNDVLDYTRDKSEFCDKYISGFDSKELQAFMANAKEDWKKIEAKYKKDSYSFYRGVVGEDYKMFQWDENLVSKLNDYLRTRNSDKPFLVYCTISLPHPPYAITQEYLDKIDKSKLPKRRPNIDQLKNTPSMLRGIFSKQQLGNWTEDQWDDLRAIYLGMVNKFDELYGSVSETLKAQNIYDETNIIVSKIQ